MDSSTTSAVPAGTQEPGSTSHSATRAWKGECTWVMHCILRVRHPLLRQASDSAA
jgi:hypothetical protein